MAPKASHHCKAQHEATYLLKAFDPSFISGKVDDAFIDKLRTIAPLSEHIKFDSLKAQLDGELAIHPEVAREPKPIRRSFSFTRPSFTRSSSFGRASQRKPPQPCLRRPAGGRRPRRRAHGAGRAGQGQGRLCVMAAVAGHILTHKGLSREDALRGVLSGEGCCASRASPHHPSYRREAGCELTAV